MQDETSEPIGFHEIETGAEWSIRLAPSGGILVALSGLPSCLFPREVTRWICASNLRSCFWANDEEACPGWKSDPASGPAFFHG